MEAVRRRVSAGADLSQSRGLLALRRRPREGATCITKKALALDPEEPFNVVFAAAFLAGNGGARRRRRRCRWRQKNEGLLCASYNLAAIYAQLGDRNKALALLKRHFFEYERYDAVRSKEMMEARVDAVFASILKDPEFIVADGGGRRQAADAPRPALISDRSDPTIRCSRRFRAPTPGNWTASRSTSRAPATAASSASSTSRASAGPRT